MNAPGLLPRFWSKVIEDQSGCWLWTGCVVGGYGHVKVDGSRACQRQTARERRAAL